ncbi:MAG: transglutaminase family protein [Gemmatimonadaceae bacterium]|nr:transglutaminase family protein [Acetobacteraceae bacterium]
MPHVRIVHLTEYSYDRPVHPTVHRLMLRPRDSHDLRLRSATLTVSPPPSRTRWAHDVFGNSVCYLEWEGTQTTLLRIASTLEIDHYPALADLPLEPSAETYPFSYTTAEAPDLARSLERHCPDPHRTVDAWAHSFLNQAGPTRTMDLLVAMTKAIKADFTYRARDAEGTNAATVTLATRTGACRDLALLMMEGVRALGLAAQFVSGYLYDEGVAGGGHSVVGGGATHAWCAVYLPGAGWVEFDPTNGLVAGRNLVRICSARTPEQAIPVTGAYVGRSSDFRSLRVAVDVVVGDAMPCAA